MRAVLVFLMCFIPSLCLAETIHLDTQSLKTPLERKAATLLTNRLEERGIQTSLTPKQGVATVQFQKDNALSSESFRIGRKGRNLTVAACDGRGFIYAVGAILSGLPWDGSFQYDGMIGESSPQLKIRGIYFATHFGNWYHSAPLNEVKRYIEDMALYGFNLLSVWYDFHHYTGIDDPNAEKMISRLHEILHMGNEVGLGGAMILLANEAYSTSPKEMRAVPFPAHYKVEICPSSPGGMDKILEYRASMLDRFSDLDIEYFCIWPYDQGGCRCPQCSPWGSNGFLKTSEPVAKMIRKKLPKAKIVLSTWEFGYFFPDDIEWKEFYQKMAEKPNWVDAVMIEHHGNYPAFVVKNGRPGDYPVLNFPEISMHGMTPWGGFGANIQANRLQSVWNNARKIVAGGFPYSEGLFEDINKYICAKLYWTPDRDVRSIVEEYAQRFFSKKYAKEITDVIYLLGDTMQHEVNQNERVNARKTPLTQDGHTSPVVYRIACSDSEKMGRSLKMLNEIKRELPQKIQEGFRWKILYCRAALDHELNQSGGRPTLKSEEYFKILGELYYDEHVTKDVIPFMQVPHIHP